ncbi:hypothetical protein F511_19892 [Dorcoceras hygrometricum]|uniref:Uncharacterized protein n=1 Tax=Dorcoceras hygrometricum TaxID=472368 RepID=A0A2Z7BUX8_9LAMI|nr:hypothetical protein F511_19892 [Dorcoceras hygrometricum]
MQAALSKLVTENEELRSKSEEILSENQWLAGIIRSWIRSSVSLQRLHRAKKPSGDKTGLGFNSDEGSTTETSSTPMLESTKFRNFVKYSAGQPKEAQSGDDMIVAKPPIWQGRFCGLGYSIPKKSREIWLNKRIIQMRGKPKKYMMAEEKKSAWADSDSEESNSGTSSSSESEDEVQCLMADETEEIFDFSSLNLHSYETNDELVVSSYMQAALSKLVTENEELRSKSEEILSENQRLAGIISSWIRSSVSLQRLHRATKPSGDKTGLGYNSDEGSTTETSSNPMLESTKFRNFVKYSAGQPKEAQSGDDMIVSKPPIWQGATIKMKPEESMAEFDERFSCLVIELARLNKTYSNQDLALKVMRALSKKWDVKTMAMRESKHLNKMELHDLFANLKAYEFELETRAEAEPSNVSTYQSSCSYNSRARPMLHKKQIS